MWGQRKCNIGMHMMAAVICLFSETPKCGIPLGIWLGVQFVFLILESGLMELRERMQASLYWSDTENRCARKCVTTIIVAAKELSEIYWQIYGASLYFSNDSDGCSDENQALMIVFVIFLVVAALKIVLVSCVCCFVVIALAARKL